VIGLIENMSFYQDSNGEKIEIFGSGNAERFCAQSGIKFLGKVPLHPEISAGCDKGVELKDNRLIAQLSGIEI